MKNMIPVPGGLISLYDEKAHRGWRVDVAPFFLSAHLYTRDDGSGLPLTDVSWNDAVRLCNRLSIAEGRTPCYTGLGDDVDRDDARAVVCDFAADGYRLPSEAEWEHACRAGSNDVRYGDLDDIAWHRGNAAERLHAVGEKRPNAWGLYDMIGNAWEWCHDLYDAAVYGPYRVFRGGGYADLPHSCRASCRRKSHPTFRIDDIGLRLARSR